MDLQLPPPDNYEDFENLVCDLMNAELGGYTFKRYGRSGQRQEGIDVYSTQHKIVIQGKLRKLNNIKKLPIISELKRELESGIEMLDGLPDGMATPKEYILAHTWLNDIELDDFAASISSKNNINARYMSWDEIIDKLNRHKRIRDKYYESTQAIKPLTKIPGYSPSSLIGRKKELADLHKYLIEDRVPVTLMNGIGGMGKTSIANAYVNAPEYINAYRAIAWVSVGNDLPQSFFSAFGGPSGFYEYDPKITPDDNFHHLLKTLRDSAVGKLKPSLLVLDNINETAMLDKYDRTLKDLGWRCLITSRTNVESFKTILVDALSYEEASELFQKHFKKPIEEQQLKELLNTIEYNTLLIDLLAKAGQKDPRISSIADINSALAKADLNAPELQRLVDSDHPDSQPIEDGVERQRRIKIAAYLKEIFKFTDLSEGEKQCLRYFSLLPSEPVSFEWMIEVFGVKANSKEDFIDLLGELERKGWIQICERNYNVHSLVKSLVRNELNVNIETCGDFILSFSNFLFDKCIRNLKFGFNFLKVGNHIAKFIFVKEDDTYLKVACHLFNNLGSLYYNYGDLGQALYYHKAGQIYLEKITSPVEMQLASNYSNIGLIHRDLGDLISALDCFLAAKDLIEEVEDYKLSLASIYDNIASIYFENGDFKKALNFFNQSCIIRESKSSRNCIELATSYSNLGQVNRHIGNVYLAIEFFGKALEIFRQNNLLDTPEIAIAYNNIAHLLKDIGEYEIAISLFKMAISIQEKLYPEYHLLIANPYQGLGKIFYLFKDYENAKQCIDKTVAIRRKFLPPDHISLLNSIEDQKIVYNALNLPPPEA